MPRRHVDFHDFDGTKQSNMSLVGSYEPGRPWPHSEYLRRGDPRLETTLPPRLLWQKTRRLRNVEADALVHLRSEVERGVDAVLCKLVFQDVSDLVVAFDGMATAQTCGRMRAAAVEWSTAGPMVRTIVATCEASRQDLSMEAKSHCHSVVCRQDDARA